MEATDPARSRTRGSRRPLDKIGRVDDLIHFVPVESEAAAVGFAGSPTFTVDGADLFDTAGPRGALTCRVYPTPDGFAGVPEMNDLVVALARLDNDLHRSTGMVST